MEEKNNRTLYEKTKNERDRFKRKKGDTIRYTNTS